MQTKDIQTIEEQIAKLQQRRDALKQKSDQAFLKKLYDICGDAFSPELILGIVSVELEKATSSQKEAWMNAGITFWTKPAKAKRTPS